MKKQWAFTVTDSHEVSYQQLFDSLEDAVQAAKNEETDGVIYLMTPKRLGKFEMKPVEIKKKAKKK